MVEATQDESTHRVPEAPCRKVPDPSDLCLGLGSQSQEAPGVAGAATHRRCKLQPKALSPTLQLLLLLPIPACLGLLSLDSEPTDRAYRSGSNSLNTRNAVTQVR